jgi:hypothetical protein
MAKRTRSVTIDQAQFVPVEHGFIFPPRPARWPRNMSTTKECIESAIYMASQIQLVDHDASTFRSERVRAAYFRACLTELCRIEDVAKSIKEPISFYGSNDPSLHLVKLLRNYQVHIASSELTTGQALVQFAGEHMVYRSFIVDNISVTELRKLESANPYSESQLEEIVALFESHQRKFGVVQLLYHLAKRVELYAQSALTWRSTSLLSVAGRCAIKPRSAG